MEILEQIRNAGVVGAGGAGFPTHAKLNCQAEIVIANGAECEPLLRVDQQLMQYNAKEILYGLQSAMKATGAKLGVIALKKHYGDAVHALKKVLVGVPDIQLHLMRSYYPAGDEQQIVYEVTGRVVPTGGLPLDVGVVVDNVGTLLNVAMARRRVPTTDKYVTVGGAVNKPCTVRVAIGTNAQELIQFAGGTTEECDYIIGGPCMGQVVGSLDFPITKTTGGLIAIPKNHALLAMKSTSQNLKLIQAACCQCSFCTQMCPRNALGLNVTPHKIMRTIGQGINLIENINGIFSCCDCGICTYQACNFGLKPHHIMRQVKAELVKAGIEAQKEVYGPVDPAIEMKRLPTSRLISRLGIEEYNVSAPLCEERIEVKQVRIPLKMHVGKPSNPIVKSGQGILRGDLIADIPEGSLGAKIHASIDGIITDITGEYIEIKVK